VFLGDNLTTKIIGLGRFQLILQDGRSRTLTCVLHILGLERNMIFIMNVSDAGGHTLFQKDLCNMVRGVMVLMKGFRIGTLYKLLGSVDLTGCNNIIVPKVDSTLNRIDSTQVESIQDNSIGHHKFDLAILWHERCQAAKLKI
jgi:hypothetical protein